MTCLPFKEIVAGSTPVCVTKKGFMNLSVLSSNCLSVSGWDVKLLTHAPVCKRTTQSDCKSDTFGFREFESLLWHATQNGYALAA